MRKIHYMAIEISQYRKYSKSISVNQVQEEILREIALKQYGAPSLTLGVLFLLNFYQRAEGGEALIHEQR